MDIHARVTLPDGQGFVARYLYQACWSLQISVELIQGIPPWHNTTPKAAAAQTAPGEPGSLRVGVSGGPAEPGHWAAIVPPVTAGVTGMPVRRTRNLKSC